jgi:hypothetical protein
MFIEFYYVKEVIVVHACDFESKNILKRPVN